MTEQVNFYNDDIKNLSTIESNKLNDFIIKLSNFLLTDPVTLDIQIFQYEDIKLDITYLGGGNFGKVYKISNGVSSYAAKILSCDIDRNGELDTMVTLENKGLTQTFSKIYASYSKFIRTKRDSTYNCVFYMRIESGDICNLLINSDIKKFKIYICQCLINIYTFQKELVKRHHDVDKCGNFLYNDNLYNNTFELNNKKYEINSDKTIILGDFGMVTYFEIELKTVMVPGKGFEKVQTILDNDSDYYIFITMVFKLIQKSNESTLSKNEKITICMDIYKLRKLEDILDYLLK